MQEFVDRAQMIRVIDRLKKQKGLNLSTNERKYRNQVLNELQRVVRGAPQVKPDKTMLVKVQDKQQKGYWIKHDNAIQCSECKNLMFGQQRYSFCPDCGAKMGMYIECG